MNITLSKEDAQELYLCICCRLGFIETGEVMLRASDAVNSGQQHLIKALSIDQMKTIIKLEEINKQLLNS